jgi:hypothetical protein
MKTTTKKYWVVIWAAVLTMTAAYRASADQAATAAQPGKTYTGMVIAVDLKEGTLETKGILLDKKFNLGGSCSYTMLDQNPGTARDLRPGEKIAVTYQNVGGVLVAGRIEQLPMRLEGMVKTLDPAHQTVTVHVRGMDKTFQIANNCNVELRNDNPGTLADIQIGNHVTVTYETPGNTPTARQIAQTSESFAGKLTAIDLEERTVKAKTVFDSKKFNLADNCAIVINGKPDGRLSDLKPDDQLVFSYDEIDGVNVVNRIAPDQSTSHPSAVVSTGSGSPY